MPDKVFFVINKFAGTGFQPKIEGHIIDVCARLSLECTIEYTQHKGHATELAREAALAGFKRVFAMGGDGTINETAQGLVGTDAAMGIIAKGSGNGLARHLTIPLNFKKSLNLLDDYQIIDVDVMRVNGKLSANVSGVGFDAHIADKFANHTHRGLAGYTTVVLREFAAFRDFTSHLVLDNQPMDARCFILAFANSSQFGNNARVAPQASVQDGLIDVCFVKKVPFTEIIPFAAKMFSGQAHISRFIEIKKARHLTVQLETPLPWHVDGEPLPPEKNFEIAIEPGALKVIVPKDCGKV